MRVFYASSGAATTIIANAIYIMLSISPPMIWWMIHYYFIHVQLKCYHFRDILLYQSKYIVFKEVVLPHLPLQTEKEGRNQQRTERENDLLLRKLLMFVCGWLSSAQFTSAVHWARTTHTHTHARRAGSITA